MMLPKQYVHIQKSEIRPVSITLHTLKNSLKNPNILDP